MNETPGGAAPEAEARVPLRALVLSLLALAVAGIAGLVWPESLADLGALVWLLALVPSFLYAYHRGWEGAAGGLAVAMTVLILIEVVPALVTGSKVDWRIAGALTVVFIAGSLGAGGLAEVLRRQRSSALVMAYHDQLTGLPNRRMLDLFLQQHFAAAQRGGIVSVVMFDLDGFKGYNDSYGHAAGDAALSAFASILRHETRTSDMSGRYGGEEFLAMLPGEGVQGARLYANRVRESLARHEMETGESITVSAGVAESGPTMNAAFDLIRAADASLYAAKAGGGNRVEPAPGSAAGLPIIDAG